MLPDVTAYLRRLKIDAQPQLTSKYLHLLHAQHVIHIPFENIDIQNKKLFTLEPTDIFQKVITNHRGGFCYELNKLFYLLLKELGFDVHIIAARIPDKDGKEGPMFDHMALIVTTDKTWLVDVGFGDLFIHPPELVVGVQQPDRHNIFRIDALHNKYALMMTDHEGNFQQKYTFDVRPRPFADFENISLEKQTSADSWFVQNFVCTRATETGRVTIMNNTFRTLRDRELTEVSIRNEEHRQQILRDHFSITL